MDISKYEIFFAVIEKNECFVWA